MAYYARVHSKNYNKLKKNIKLLIIQRRIKQHDETRNDTSHTSHISHTSHTLHTSHKTQSHTIHRHWGRIKAMYPSQQFHHILRGKEDIKSNFPTILPHQISSSKLSFSRDSTPSQSLLVKIPGTLES